jgi:DNA-binding LacI/PurR family transcriptional regulator
MSSVAQPLVQAARDCLDLLLHRLSAGERQAHPRTSPQHRLLVPELVVRSGWNVRPG